MPMYCPQCNEPCEETTSTYCGSMCPECLKAHVAGCDICAEDFDESEG
jgi:hypothetical protein